MKDLLAAYDNFANSIWPLLWTQSSLLLPLRYPTSCLLSLEPPIHLETHAEMKKLLLIFSFPRILCLIYLDPFPILTCIANPNGCLIINVLRGVKIDFPWHFPFGPLNYVIIHWLPCHRESDLVFAKKDSIIRLIINRHRVGLNTLK